MPERPDPTPVAGLPITRAELRRQRQTQPDAAANVSEAVTDSAEGEHAPRSADQAGAAHLSEDTSVAEDATDATEFGSQQVPNTRRARREEPPASPRPKSKTSPEASRTSAPQSVATTSRSRDARRVAATFSTLGVMGIIGLLTVGMTTPMAAVASADAPSSSTTVEAPGTDSDSDEIQAYVTAAGTAEPDLSRDEMYQTSTLAELAAASGIRNFANTFTNDPTAAIQWPFSVGVPISSGYGMRNGRMHQGIDLTPGAGAPVQAIADGTVRVSTEAGGAYGVHVIIDHEIDGQLVSSHYAHMQYGSLKVVAGEHVTVGTVIGNTGNTGRSYGANTHFEILMNGTTAVDPMAWMRAHAGG